MLPFPFSLLVLLAAAVLGVVYVRMARTPWAPARAGGRAAVLVLTGALPLATEGPGPAQLTVGLLVGFLGIRMVALGERWKPPRHAPPPGRILAAMVTPEEILAPVPWRRTAPGVSLAWGLAGATLCVGLLVLGNKLRLWRWSRAADDLLVFIEVAVGTAGIDAIFVGGAGLAGWSVAGLLDHPIRSASLSEFWSRRWNRLVAANLARGFFRPHGRRRRWALGTVAAFAASGAMHVLAVLDVRRLGTTLAPAAIVMGFFLLHALLVLTERRLGLDRPPASAAALFWGRLRTLILFAALSPLLLDPFATVVHVHGRAFTPTADPHGLELQRNTDVAVVERVVLEQH